MQIASPSVLGPQARGLSLLNGSIALSALLAITAQQMGYQQWFFFLKPLTTILILIVPFRFGNRQLTSYRYGILLALVFCLAGDVFLLKESQFIYGLGAFLVAHLLFSYSFISLGGFRKEIAPFLLLLAIGAGVYFLIQPGLGALAPAVLVYIAAIVFMGWQGLSLYLWKPTKTFMLVGMAVLLFIFSDSIIAINKFRFPFALSGVLILATYWCSIALLANSTCRRDR
ncbi:MAG: lysoplasmalogenase [Bacteroidota bacterium]